MCASPSTLGFVCGAQVYTMNYRRVPVSDMFALAKVVRAHVYAPPAVGLAAIKEHEKCRQGSLIYYPTYQPVINIKVSSRARALSNCVAVEHQSIYRVPFVPQRAPPIHFRNLVVCWVLSPEVCS